MAERKPYLAILDVGHGNSAVLANVKGTVIIDAGPGIALYLFLKEEGINEIDAVLLSHADKDHIAGLLTVISCEEFTIKRVCVNSDAIKESKLWDDLLHVLDKSCHAGKLEFGVSLTKTDTGTFDQDNVRVEILAPTPYLAGKGPGSTDRLGRKLTSNSVSAVIRLSINGKPFVVLPSDIDDIGLSNLVADSSDVTAPVAVFPHHGAKPSRCDPKTFTEEFCSVFQPRTVIFSNGRGIHATPSPQIISALRKAIPSARIMCTQLSEHCSTNLSPIELKHLTEKFARGKEKGICCAGTISIELANGDLVVRPGEADHKSFIEEAATTPLCCMAQSGRTKTVQQPPLS